MSCIHAVPDSVFSSLRRDERHHRIVNPKKEKERRANTEEIELRDSTSSDAYEARRWAPCSSPTVDYLIGLGVHLGRDIFENLENRLIWVVRVAVICQKGKWLACDAVALRQKSELTVAVAVRETTLAPLPRHDTIDPSIDSCLSPSLIPLDLLILRDEAKLLWTEKGSAGRCAAPTTTWTSVSAWESSVRTSMTTGLPYLFAFQVC